MLWASSQDYWALNEQIKLPHKNHTSATCKREREKKKAGASSWAEDLTIHAERWLSKLLKLPRVGKEMEHKEWFFFHFDFIEILLIKQNWALHTFTDFFNNLPPSYLEMLSSKLFWHLWGMTRLPNSHGKVLNPSLLTVVTIANTI